MEIEVRPVRPLLDASIERAALADVSVERAPHWNLAELVGRLSELCGWRASPVLSFALALVLDAQCSGENAAWITPKASSFFPPDAAENGVDLDALLVVRVKEAADAARAADIVARSGSFGLIVIDLGARAHVSMAILARLSGLARAHGAAIVFLTEKPREEASLGSLISLRADARFVASGTQAFTCELCIAKDKRRAGTWKHTEERHGPDGLC
jgi:recombination protein RecA